MKRLLLLTGVLAAVSFAQVRLPQYTRQVLPNGLVLDVMPLRGVPLVTVRIVVRGGSESEPAQFAGLSSITASTLRRGTKKRTAEQFSRELDLLGATFSADTDEQSSSIEAEFLSRDLDAGLDLVLDAFMNPVFPETEIKRELAQRIDGVKSTKDNPGAAAGAYYRAFFYGPEHPYGTPADEASLGRITRAEIAAYHGRMYGGKNMIVAVVGDLDAAGRTKIERLFAAIPAREAYQWKKAPERASKAARIAIVDKPDATQTNFLIGQPGIPRNHPDRVPLWIVNTLFGGRFTSMLNDELRVNSGLTYGASSRFDQARLPGRITISSFTKTENTQKAIDLALDIVRRLRETGITAAQLASAKTYLKGTFPAERLETSDQLADVLAEIELNDLNRGEIDDLFSRIDAVTVEQANEVAKRYFNTGNLTFLLLGDASKFRSEVKKYATEVVEGPIARPGFTLGR